MLKVPQQAVRPELLITVLLVNSETCVRRYERGTVRIVTRGPSWARGGDRPSGPGRGDVPSLWGLRVPYLQVHCSQLKVAGRGEGQK